jgi:hypothetical protein
MSKPTEPLTPERLAEIQARADAATPGPWQWHISRRTLDYRLQTAGWDVVMGFARWGRNSAQPEFNIDGLLHHGADLGQPHPDAEFIAHARQDVADLVAEVGWLAAELADRTAELTTSACVAEQAWERNTALLAENARLRAELNAKAERAWDDPVTLDAQAYRYLADGISATMADQSEWDGDDSEEAILLRYVQHLAEATAVCADCGHLQSAHHDHTDGDPSGCDASGAKVRKCTCWYFIPTTAEAAR